MPTLCVRFVIAEGDADGEDAPDLPGRDRQTPARAVDDGPRVDGQVAAVTQREPDEIGVGADVGDHGGTGRTRSTPAESVDEQGIEHDVDRRAGHRTDHGLHGVAFGAQQVGRRHRHDDEWRADDDQRVEVGGILPSVVSGAEQREHRVAERQAQHQNQQAGGDGGIEAERAESLAVGEPVLAEQARDDRTAAEAEDVAEGDHHGEHWRGEGDARHHIGVSRMRDEIGVDHVVHQGDEHAEHHGHRQREIRLRNRRLFEEFVIHFRPLVFRSSVTVQDAVRRASQAL